MKEDYITKHLKSLEENPTYDKDFIEILSQSYTAGTEGEQIANRVISVINSRYAENKKTKT